MEEAALEARAGASVEALVAAVVVVVVELALAGLAEAVEGALVGVVVVEKPA